MKTNVEKIKIGDVVQITEPTQKFSCDCVIISKIKKDKVLAICNNDDQFDGKKIEYSIGLFNSSKIVIL